MYFPQRKFAREVPDAKTNTFKRFREWLDDTFTGGTPADDEWETIIREDEEYDYTVSSTVGAYDPADGTLPVYDHDPSGLELQEDGLLGYYDV